jgi:hypothetical protein
VLNSLQLNNIEICFVQETELDMDFPVHTLNSTKYFYEAEKSTVKNRVGFYLNKLIPCKRREDLE